MHADARLTVATTDDGTICALQKGGEEAMSDVQVMEMIDLAILKANELRQKL